MNAHRSRKSQAARRHKVALILAAWCSVLTVFLLVMALMHPLNFFLAALVAAYAIYQVRRMGRRARRNTRRRH